MVLQLLRTGNRVAAELQRVVRGQLVPREILASCGALEQTSREQIPLSRSSRHFHPFSFSSIGSWAVFRRYPNSTAQAIHTLRARHMRPRHYSLTTPMRGASYEESDTRWRVHQFLMGFVLTCFVLKLTLGNTQIAHAEEGNELSSAEISRLQTVLGLRGYAPPTHLSEAGQMEHRLFSLFHAAYRHCEEGNIGALKQIAPLLSRLYDEQGRTVFIKAVDEGKRDLVSQLLNAGIGFEDKDRGGNTGLHIAAQNGNLELVKLLAGKIPFNEPNNIKETPLHLAIRFGQSEIVAELVGRGASEPWENSEGVLFSPPAYAILRGQIKCFQKIFEADVLGLFSLDEYVREIGNFLHLAIHSGHPKMLKALLAHVPEFLLNQRGAEGLPPLHYASSLGSYECVNILLGAQAKFVPDMQQRSPVHWAAIRENPAVLGRLLQLQPSIGMDANTMRPIEYLKGRGGPRATECRALLISYDKGVPITLSKRPDFYHEPPTTLSFGGGGVKAIPYPSALEIISEQGMLAEVVRFGGTSAGSVVAAFCGVGVSPQRLLKELVEQDFQEFMVPETTLKGDLFDAMQDGSAVQAIKGLISAYWRGSDQVDSWNPVERARQLFSQITEMEGLCDGKHIRTWVEKLLKEQIKDTDNITFAELHELVKKYPGKYKDVYVFATVLKRGAPSERVCISHKHPVWKDMPIAIGVQASCSYPGVYKPCTGQVKLKSGQIVTLTDDETGEPTTRFIDGGILFNNPRAYFNRPEFQEQTGKVWGERTNRRTLGLVLESEQQAAPNLNIRGPKNLLAALASTYIHAQQTLSNEYEEDCTLKIAIPPGISAFSKLTKGEKEALIKAGKTGAEAFLFPEGKPGDAN